MKEYGYAIESLIARATQSLKQAGFIVDEGFLRDENDVCPGCGSKQIRNVGAFLPMKPVKMKVAFLYLACDGCSTTKPGFTDDHPQWDRIEYHLAPTIEKWVSTG